MQRHAHKIHDPKKVVPHLRAQRNISRTRRRRQYITLVILAIFVASQFLISLYNHGQIPQGADSDIIYGGATSKEELILSYDQPSSKFSLLASSLGIDRKAMSQVRYTPEWTTTELHSLPAVVWSTSPNYFPASSTRQQDNGAIAAIKDPASRYIFYGTPIEAGSLYILDTQPVYTGKTQQGISFAILANSGNIITSWDTAQNVNFCYRSPDPESILNCPNSNRYITSMSIENMSYKTDGHFIKNRPGDTLRYALKIRNDSSDTLTLQPRLHIGDVLEYSETVSVDNGIIDLNHEIVQWPTTSIPAGEEHSFKFLAGLKKDIPTTRQNETNAASNDCRLSVYYGVADTVAIVCPPPKVIERSITRVLRYDPTILGAWVLLMSVSLLAIRNDLITRKLDHEIIKYQGGHTL
jgi:hypothetical protein